MPRLRYKIFKPILENRNFFFKKLLLTRIEENRIRLELTFTCIESGKTLIELVKTHFELGKTYFELGFTCFLLGNTPFD